MAEINAETKSLRLAVSAPSYSDIHRLVKADAWSLAADYDKGSGDSRGYIINNGTGRPAVIDLAAPEKEGPLSYDVRPVLTPENADMLPGDGFATVSCDDGRKYLFMCSRTDGRDNTAFGLFSLAQVEMRALPDEAVPTMENIGAAEPLKDFAGHAKEIDVYDREGSLLLSSPVEIAYMPDIRLEHDIEADAIPFGIDFGREFPTAVYDIPDAGEADIADDEERGL